MLTLRHCIVCIKKIFVRFATFFPMPALKASSPEQLNLSNVCCFRRCMHRELTSGLWYILLGCPQPRRNWNSSSTCQDPCSRRPGNRKPNICCTFPGLTQLLTHPIQTHRLSSPFLAIWLVSRTTIVWVPLYDFRMALTTDTSMSASSSTFRASLTTFMSGKLLLYKSNGIPKVIFLSMPLKNNEREITNSWYILQYRRTIPRKKLI